MNNIQSVSDSFLCSNCGACKAICPTRAISMKLSSIGRMYASVNEDCIDCGLCTKVCPSLNQPLVEDSHIGCINSVFTGRATDEQIFMNAQSGGVCTAILKYLFEHHKIDCAVVCRMSFGEFPIVESVAIENVSQLHSTQKSCYTPVDMLSRLRNVKDKESVAFVGLPCQIQGLTHLQKTSKSYRNVKYKLGLICERTLCGGIQNVFLAKAKQKGINPSLFKIDWKRKAVIANGNFYTYGNAPIVLYTKSEEYVIPNVYRFLLKDFFTPPRCRICEDKMNASADIVLGDPWGMKNIEMRYGESVIITRTAKGDELIREMKQGGILKLIRRDSSEIIQGQHINERKISVATYSKAFNVLPLSVNSYLLDKSEGILVNNKEKNKCERELLNFLSLEKRTKKEIVAMALKIIERYERIHDNFLYHFLSRVRNKIVFILKRYK
ncbi:Coenzyme F420 hydrogenase/dehydrogenase, beta subunit C-terminal domain [uncultured Bacteroides sp.]|uniref:Coenzyme F420 hydrogenase/dehydrogenase, beta subunit C-terminal domain n=1 Tax=uncultured Bacteroides sp. TaxID=162156 RepID=UPI0025B691ED|nr:Coenzyme F420 hydrogenase/dehydrogenase, beta subunit C-terminal domain [uncultured Bacteroides sp.]